MKTEVISAATEAEFVQRGVECLQKIITEATHQNGKVIVGLSGGSTPKPIYEALGKEKVDWSKVWIFLIDDRYVRPDDPNSNQFLLRSTLLKHAPIPESQIIFPDTTLPIDQCVPLYDRHLKDLLKKGLPDLVTLGMGDDGHIASLFPPLSNNAFGPAFVIHTTTEKFSVRDRISVTLPVLTTARQSIFFLKGAEKKRVWEEMMASEGGEKRWPAKAMIDKTDASVIAQW